MFDKMTDIKSDNVEPLVSVCIITYNSSKYILEALDSVYCQTYQNIELIVSDDGSKDDTVAITEEWLKNKRDRFVDVKLLTVEHNTGTAKNCNRALRATKGELIKSFAGDDVLFPNAIEKYVSYIKDKPEVKWVFAKVVRYNQIISDKSIMHDAFNYDNIKSVLNKSQLDQFRKLVISNFLWYPTHFFKKSLLESIGGYDESFGIYEDYPRSLRLYRNGEQCYFLDDFTVGYRHTSQGVVNNSRFLVNKKIRYLAFVARKRFALDKLTWVEKFGTYLLYGLDMFFAIPFMNKRTRIRTFLRGASNVFVKRLCFFLQRWVKI